MGDRIWERIVILPFFIGCSSESSVDVATTQPTKPETRRRESKEAMKMKKSWGLHRLVKSFKSFSQLFVYKEEKEEDTETEMEIGFPTDVKHVTHIGWDGTTTTNPVKGWENLTPHELLSFPSISLKQFELAMAAQAGAPLCLTTTSKFT